MSSLISFSLNLDKLDKSKVVKGKNGNYLSLTVSVNDETSMYGYNVGVFESQSKEEREAKAKKNYVGNGKVVWTDGNVVLAQSTEELEKAPLPEAADIDLPF